MGSRSFMVPSLDVRSTSRSRVANPVSLVQGLRKGDLAVSSRPLRRNRDCLPTAALIRYFYLLRQFHVSTCCADITRISELPAFSLVEKITILSL